MAGNRKPPRPFKGPIWTHMAELRERQDRMADGLEKLATMVQVLSQAYGRIISRAQASAAEEERQQAAGADVAVGETVSEGGIIIGAKAP